MRPLESQNGNARMRNALLQVVTTHIFTKNMFFGENDEFGGLSMLQTSKVVKIVVQKVVAKGCFTACDR